VPLHYAASVIPIGARAVELEMKRLLAGAWRNSGLSDDLLEDHAGAIVSAACRVQARGANTSGDAAAKGDAAVYRCAGKDVRIDAEWRTMPCEVLFGYKNRGGEEELHGVVEHSLMTAVATTLARLNIDSRLVVENIVLSGGMACVPGFSKRVQEELVFLASRLKRGNSIGSLQCLARARIIRVPFPPRIVSWCGASLVGSVETLRELSLSRQQWREDGMRLVDRSALA